MKPIPVPPSLEEGSFDALVATLNQTDEERLLLDARRLRWVDPYGMTGLLSIGGWLKRQGRRATLQLPDNTDVTSYLSRMDFYRHAQELFEVHGQAARPKGGGSDVLLEVTPIRSHGDIHQVVDRVQERAGRILTTELHYPRASAVQFSVMLSEVCQNVVEHAQADGWVAAQRYDWKQRLGRKVVVIAVMDLGIGFRGSLGSEHGTRYADRWSDATALEGAFIHGLTRFADPGRGQGIQQIRRVVKRWDGRVTVRSGSARIADVPEWDEHARLQTGLAQFPGSQIGIVLPARVPEAGDDTADAADRPERTEAVR